MSKDDYEANVIKKFIELNDNVQGKWKKMFGGRTTMTDIARQLIPIQELPPGAMPTYERDVDVAKIVVPEDLGFQGWTGPNTVAQMLDPEYTPYNKDAWIQTFTGRKFHPLNPSISEISLLDIAHALSNICRFTGHAKEFYSVAQHCVLVSYICDSQDALHGLLHDASEAYLSDISRPLKHSGFFEEYKKIEHNLQSLIFQKFGLSMEEPKGVKLADTTLLATEARDLLSPLHPDWNQPAKPLPFTITALPPKEAKALFLERFEELNCR